MSSRLEQTGLSLDRAATAAGTSAKVGVNLSRNPFTRTVQKGVYGAQRALPQGIPVLGERAAAQRSVATQFRHEAANVHDGQIISKTIKHTANYGKGNVYRGERTIQTPRTMGDVRSEFRDVYGEPVEPALNKFSKHVDPGGVLGKSTQVWKDLVLAARPAFQVNNFVGNQIMYHLSNGVFGASKSLSQSARGELDAAANKFFTGSLHTLGSTEKGEGASLYRRVINKSYGVQGKHETALRKATMRDAAMSIPEIKTLVRKYIGEGEVTSAAHPETLGPGLFNKQGKVWGHEIVPAKAAVKRPVSEGEALSKALDDVLEGPNGKMYQQEIARKIDDTLGDYANYTATEQRVKKIIPFYGWNRHASRFLYGAARDKPHQLLALNQISKIGAQAHLDNGWAGTPDFMKGYLHIGGKTFDTHGLNPLTGATDTLKSVKQVVNGDPSIGEAANNLNPFIGAGIQALTGKSLLTGAPIQRSTHGILGSVAQQTITGLPQWKLAMKAVPDGGPDTSNPHTYLTPTGLLRAKFKDKEGHVKLDSQGNPVEQENRHMLNSSFQSMLASFIGLPDRGNVNKDVAREVAKTIETEKHPDQFRARKKSKKKKKVTFKDVTGTTRSSGWGASDSNWGG
jgi:hypothetical protein